MASVNALGRHTPAALDKLINESLLPKDPEPDTYVWQVYCDHTSYGGEDELLSTSNCVIWSSNGVVKRIFRFDRESKRVLHAVLTTFRSNRSAVRGKNALNTSTTKLTAAPSHSNTYSAGHQKPPTRDTKSSIHSNEHLAITHEPAVLIVLEHEAHIYFTQGAQYIINLPFNVDRIFPTLNGVVFQREVVDDVPYVPSPVPPTVPNNTFRASQDAPWTGTHQRSISIPHHDVGRHQHQQRARLSEIVNELSSYSDDSLPKLFTLTDPLSPLQALGCSYPIPKSDRYSNTQFLSTDSIAELDKDEELLYLSPKDEMECFPNPSSKPLVLALTLNRIKGTLAIWRLVPRFNESRTSRRKSNHVQPILPKSHRHSSHGTRLSTGTQTPLAPNKTSNRDRSFNTQRSFGGSQDSEIPQSEIFDLGLRKNDPLTSAEVSSGNIASSQASISTRRTSSILARTELPAPDQAPYSDLSRKPTNSRGSFGGNNKKSLHTSGLNERASFGRTRLSGRFSTSASMAQLSDVDEQSFVNNSSDDTITSDRTYIDANSNTHNSDNNGDKLELRLVWMAPIMNLGLIDIIESEKAFTKEKIQVVPSVNSGTQRKKYPWLVNIFINCKVSSSLVHMCVKIGYRDIRKRSQEHGKQNLQDVERIWIPSRNIGVRLHSTIIDSLRIQDGPIVRLIILRQYLRQIWLSVVADFDDDVSHVSLWSPSDTRDSDFPGIVDLDTGRWAIQENILNSKKLELGLSSCSGKFDLVLDSLHYQVQVKLRPSDAYTQRLLDVCNIILSGRSIVRNTFICTWWQLCQRLRGFPEKIERRALIVAIYCSILQYQTQSEKENQTPFVDRPSLEIPTSAPRKLNQYYEAISNSSKVWKWACDKSGSVRASLQVAEHERSKAPLIAASEAITHVGALLNSSANSLITIEEIQLSSSPFATLYTIPKLLIALHLLREEEKLDNLSSEVYDSNNSGIAGVLAQIGLWLRWKEWTGLQNSYFGFELGLETELTYNQNHVSRLEGFRAPFSPRPIVEWVEKIIQGNTEETYPSLRTLFPDLEHSSTLAERFRPETLAHARVYWSFTPRTDALVGFLREMRDTSELPSSSMVENLIKHGIDAAMLETLPVPVAAILMNPISRCRQDPPTTWSKQLLKLIGRHDIYTLLEEVHSAIDVNQLKTLEQNIWSGSDLRSICQGNSDERSKSFDINNPSMSHLARYIYRIDRRWDDIIELLDPLRVAVAEVKQTPGSTEAEYLEEQKEIAQRVYKRTMALPSGEALLNYKRRKPLPTEKLVVESFNTSCLMQPSNNTVNADRSNFTEEKVCWAFFHAGVRTGLSQARDSKGVDTSWLVLNKPAELGNRHAGLLFGLGLNGHLKNMAKWLAFKYLTPKHNMTSIGLLLGLSASHLGTMDSLVTRLLTVHVTRLLPPGAAELNLSPSTQTAGIMGIGLLYYNSEHRRMSEVMLSEIENTDVEDTFLRLDFRDEGYRLAAGFALGLLNLGKGGTLHALRDMNVVERLLAIATGPREVQTVHILDQATAGATIAVALLFMKSHDKMIAQRINVPTSTQQFNYSRPDILLLRVVAHNLIMWDEIKDSYEWMFDRLPSEYREFCNEDHVLELNRISEALSSRWLPLYNILAGLCWSMSLKYAGSGSTKARDCLFYFYDVVTTFLKGPYHTYDQMLTRDTLLRFQHLVALSFATVMAGTGDLDCLRRLRILHATIQVDSNFGFHQAAHMALGSLFMGQGRYTFGTSNLAIASLLCAFYPLFPRDVLDNKAHLQAFRHMWTFATEARCLVPRDVETNQPIVTTIIVSLKDGSQLEKSMPGLLPPLEDIAMIKTTSPEFWEVTLDFANNPAHLESFRKHQTLFMRRKSLLAQHLSTFAMTMATRSEARFANPQSNTESFESLFDLSIFKRLNISRAEASSILFSRGAGDPGAAVSNGNYSHSGNSSQGQGQSNRATSGPLSRSGGVGVGGGGSSSGSSRGAFNIDVDAPAPIESLLDARTTGLDDTLVLAGHVESNRYSTLVGLRMLLGWAERERSRGRKSEWISPESMNSLKAMLFERARNEQSQTEGEDSTGGIQARETVTDIKEDSDGDGDGGVADDGLMY